MKTVLDLLYRAGERRDYLCEGELGVTTADSVILATGGAGQVYDTTTNSTAGTGDGYALGYKAGAQLIDICPVPPDRGRDPLRFPRKADHRSGERGRGALRANVIQHARITVGKCVIFRYVHVGIEAGDALLT